MTEPGSGGPLVGGRYQLGELLGRGGMAEVRKGTDLRLGRTVAVKRLRTDLASDATFQARFRREAQSSASLNHPAIVAVYDTGEEMATDGSDVAQPYIVMEHVAGRTLRDVLREGRKILPERALEITSGVLSALDYSHRSGIIHRDIKPGNVMLTPSGDVKVMDFGIARAVSDAASSMTQTAAVVGTAQYLSPEQARGETVDSRSDVYSTGCLLYELLTGRPPFVGDSPVAVAYQHVREPVVPPSHHDTEIPPELDAIVVKALAKRVEERYQSAAAMRSDIERYLAGRPVQAPAVAPVPPSYADPAPTAVVPTAAGRTAEPAEDRRRGGLVAVVALLVVALVVLAAVLLPRLVESPPEQVQVPNLVGLTEGRAEALIVEAGLVAGQPDFATDPNVPEGQVISQDPNRDTFVDPGTTVTFVVSSGRPTLAVPSVTGLQRVDARAQLEAAGLRVRLREEDSDEDQGRVTRTDPAAGTTVPEGSTVTVFYSDGPEEVPDVVGRQEDRARSILEDAGFRVEVVFSNDTDQPSGTVIGQNPDGGETADQGDVVTLVVSNLEEPTPTPTPTPTESPSPTESPTLPLPSESPSPS
ncbi:Stk1 family PASTA domain-containing Ser/Thr kinase [Nocardioides perillae]|uniref:non-specific serine/threonine protein kinase n=1 Tax=Nocardioides perillae TaxID=1119534 RepID=A0A7Y9RU59_9ACTN|nr:Stk1 family PASTA domain-containing Ser/Thr kinase [Nocardioides perillae]NYG54189.1 serine/threonine-protein kinase [Nocardioides perillae]